MTCFFSLLALRLPVLPVLLVLLLPVLLLALRLPVLLLVLLWVRNWFWHLLPGYCRACYSRPSTGLFLLTNTR